MQLINSKPISLLNSLYKIYMVMIRSKMRAATEHLLAKSQYGLRPHKSTSHAISILRRIQDFAEIEGTQLNIAFFLIVFWQNSTW